MEVGVQVSKGTKKVGRGGWRKGSRTKVQREEKRRERRVNEEEENRS